MAAIYTNRVDPDVYAVELSTLRAFIILLFFCFFLL